MSDDQSEVISYNPEATGTRNEELATYAKKRCVLVFSAARPLGRLGLTLMVRVQSVPAKFRAEIVPSQLSKILLVGSYLFS